MEAGKAFVSIRCLAYNQEPYIRQCLDGFLMQKTNFRFEAIVHDDASTDGTAAIIREYAEKYPDIIKPIFETENQFSKQDGSLGRIMNEACKGKYVAICEGDDYWTDPFKLQKQVEFMEAHPQCSLCCSDAKILECGAFLSWKRYETDCVVPPEDIIIGGGMWLQTPTFLYRRATYNDYPDCCQKCHVGDFPMILWAALNGGVFCFSDATAVYRHKREGSWTSKIELLSARDQIKGWRSEVDMLKGLDEWSAGRYKDAFNHRIRDYLWYLIEDYRKDAKLLWIEFSNERQVLSKRQRLKWFGYAYIPWFFSIKRQVRRKLEI